MILVQVLNIKKTNYTKSIFQVISEPKKNIRCMFCVFSDINDRTLLNQAQQEIFQ